MYPREFIDQLLKAVPLSRLMAQYGVRVKTGSGKNDYYVSWCCGKSDFDNGRIDKIRNSYKCMACMPAKGGKNAIHFLREYVGMTYHEAVRTLAKEAGIELPAANPAAAQKTRRKAQALRLAAEFYFETRNWDYWRARGIRDDVLERSKAGYAPGGRVLRDFLEDQGFTKEELLEFRLIGAKGLDTFFRRAVLPVFRDGAVVDLYGRAIDDSPIRHLYLYGDQVLGGIDTIDPDLPVFLFEGPIDRLVAESHGIRNGVDPGGAMKFGSFHARLLKNKGVRTVVIVFDGDDAGQKGALQAGEYLERENLEVWIARLESGKDAAQILLESSLEGFAIQVRETKLPYRKYRLFRELDQYDVADIEEYLSRRQRR